MSDFKIKTIVFDLGGVYFTDGSTLAKKKIREIFNIKDINSILTVFGSAPGTIGHKIRLGLITMEEFEEECGSILKIPKIDIYHIRHLWFGSYVINYKMEEIVKELSKNYRLIVFSGNVRERIEYLDEKYDFLKYFDDKVLSYDYQLNKSDTEFYKELLIHLDCRPNEAIIIDDERKNLNKAEPFGFNLIHYYYTEKMIESLKNYNIYLNL